MAKKTKISEFMLHEHGEMFAMLAEVIKKVDHLNDVEGALESLAKLRKKQEDHVFGEENAIFILDKQKKVYPALVEIMEQHTELREIFNELQEDIENGRPAVLAAKDLRDLFKVHIGLEDSEFYPKLDKNLTEEEQEKVLKNFNEVILGNVVKAEGVKRDKRFR